MEHKPYNVLFLCADNAARSVLAASAMNNLGISREKFHAYSAGSKPADEVHPYARELLEHSGIPDAELRSKSWKEFTRPDAPQMDFIITLCDRTAGETPPVWPGKPLTARWSIPDPTAVEGSEDRQRHAFVEAFAALRARIELMASLPFDKLDHLAWKTHLQEVDRRRH